MAEVQPRANEVELKENAEKKRSGMTNTVMLVQLAVCVVAVLLIFVLGRVSPETFDFIKSEYGRMTSKSSDTAEIAASVEDAVGRLIGDTENTEQATEAVTSGSVEILPSAEDGEAVAVMSLFKSDGEITVPVHGKITSPFGNRTNPVSGEYLTHSGIDIAADSGTPIRAAYNGVVSSVGFNDVSGNYIALVHTDGSETFYCHCKEITAEKGNVVRAGESIALVGSTGRSTGSHLHFEITVDGHSVDPLLYLTVKDGAI